MIDVVSLVNIACAVAVNVIRHFRKNGDSGSTLILHESEMEILNNGQTYTCIPKMYDSTQQIN